MARLVHDQTEDVGQRDQPRVRDRAREGGFWISRSNLLGAGLSSGCAILRVLHKEILASTTEHTAALHERFAKPVPCREKTKLLLTLRQWLTDLKELQVAGSSPSKETVMQSLKTVTGWYQRPQQRTRNHRLDCANRSMGRQLASDADTRLSDSTAGAGKGAKGDLKGVYSATIPCKHHAKGACARGDKCRFSHKGSDSKPGGNGGKGKKANNERNRCNKCGKITTPHWAKTCPEPSSSAQVVLTSHPVSSSSEVAPPCLPALWNNGAGKTW